MMERDNNIQHRHTDRGALMDAGMVATLTPQFLCVRETLASGRDVIFAYDSVGAPQYCWDARSFPAKWCAQHCWHPAGVTVLHGEHQIVTQKEQVALYPLDMMAMSQWLAHTYVYLRPILGTFAIPISTRQIFRQYIERTLHDSGIVGTMIDVGGSDCWKYRFIPNGIDAISVDPTNACSESILGFNTKTQKIQQVVGLAESLPFASECASCVMCQFVLEHLIDPSVALHELVRVLEVGGLLLLGIPIDNCSKGRPAFLHRWRFTWKASANGDRTLPLPELDFASLGLRNVGQDDWKPAMQVGDACLFLLRKDT